MDRTALPYLVAISVAIAACGAAPPPDPAPAPPESTLPLREPEPRVADPEPDAPPPETAPPEPPPPPEPVVATNADELREVLFSAATDMQVFRRFVNAEHGIGAFDPTEAGIVHYCDADGLTSSPGLGFVMGVDDAFTCDRRLTRCVLQGTGDGWVFNFRRNEGDSLFIDSIAHYERRAPGTDSAAARAFARAGEGVCALYRALTGDSATPPPRLSVFVSAATGLVPETVAEHRCDAEAATAYTERIGPVTNSAPERCERDPARCTYRTGDEEVTVYGAEGAPIGVTVTRPGMRRDLATGQQRELDAFLRGMRRHTCATAEAP